MIISALIIPLLSYILQTYPRLFNRYFGVDVWTRLLEIDHVKKTGHKIPGKITKGFIIDGTFDYPIIFPWIFSFFPKKNLLKFQGFVSPFFDALQNVLVFYIALSLTHSVPVALVSQIVYTLIPMIPVENSYLTPRSLGYLMFTLSFYPLLLFYNLSEPKYFIASVAFTTLLYLTHRFALQSFIFICVFFALVTSSYIFLAVPIIGFVLAIVITKGYYLRVAKGHLYNIYFWTKNYKYRFSHQIHGLAARKKLDWVGTIYFLLSEFSPIFLIITDVWVISSFIYFFYFLSGLNIEIQTSMYFLMSLWVIFFYVFGSVILKVKMLIPIGEGQRYLEMATVPVSVLSSVLLFHFYNLYGFVVIIVFILIAIGNLSMILFIQVKGIIKDKNRSLTNELIDLFAFINKLPGTPRIMCIPHQITTMTVYHTKAEILVNADNKGLMEIMQFYPVLKVTIDELKTKYKLDYLVLKESFAKLNEIKLKNSKIIYNSNGILLIKL
jgi:hypothetical protein